MNIIKNMWDLKDNKKECWEKEASAQSRGDMMHNNNNNKNNMLNQEMFVEFVEMWFDTG